MMPRILIVEDEAPMRVALQDILTAEGYRVMTAADGEAGLERAIEEKPGLILLDVMLSEARWLRAMRRAAPAGDCRAGVDAYGEGPGAGPRDGPR
jgi:DNA-binding response OmpR family regulator